MPASIREFNVGLYQEHLEEASFLYEQRLAYLDDAELAWNDLDDVEERLEAHIDALVIGGELAFGVCQQHAKQGDFGELHAALRVFCRHGGRDHVYAVLRDLDIENAEVCRATADALKAECPAAWHGELARITARHSHLAPVLATVLGYRRFKADDVWLQSLNAATETGAAAALWALGRSAEESTVTAIEEHTRSEVAAVSEAACRAAIRLGSYRTVRYCLLAAQTRPWMSMTVALGADRSGVRVLMDRAGPEHVTDDVLLGLGLLGDLSAVRVIFDCLALPERAGAAATALQLITGAELHEEVFVADVIDPDELFDDERARFEATGELPKRGDGSPFGSTAIQPVIDQAVWKEWLSRNKSRFDPGRRYRCGEPYSPRALLRSLLAGYIPNRVRGLICDEYRVRYGIDFPMETDMPVAEQHRLLRRMAEWSQANESRFKPGEWYFHGRPTT